MISGDILQKNQWINFVAGASSEVPDPSAFNLSVLGVDDNKIMLSGGDATDDFVGWSTDILVYPTYEYWETLLNGDRIRPYLDFSISDYNTIRLPSAIDGYDLYVDNGTVYEDLTIKGKLIVGTSVLGDGGGDGGVASSDITADAFIGEARTTAPIVEIATSTYLLNESQTNTIFQCKPAGGSLTVTFPGTAKVGTTYTFNNCIAGNTVTFPDLTNARGKVLAEQFSSCTIYWDGNAWFGVGDLV